jgi:diguanylate cyclase (GGDEF)-like protein
MPARMHPVDIELSAESRSAIKQRFNATLERDYLQSVLMCNRTMIRITCAAVTVFALLRAIEHWVVSPIGWVYSVALLIIAGGSAALTAIAWSRPFEGLYRRWADIIVPVRGAVIGGALAHAVALGGLEKLMVLPLAILGPFFFLGLSLRTAAISGAATTAAFAFGAVSVQLDSSVIWHAGSAALITFFACTMLAREQELWSRRSFLAARMVERLAQQDPLTGLQNRRVFDEHLVKWWAQAIEERRRMAIVLIDVDHFKSYNDRHGHQAGDHTLRTVAEALRTFADRPEDLLARYGGEEFAAILYDVDEDFARHTAECMRVAVAQANITHRGSLCAERITVSIGVGIVSPSRGRTSQGLLQLADQALYDAKVNGRNQVVLMNEDDYRMLVTGVFTKKSAKAG